MLCHPRFVAIHVLVVPDCTSYVYSGCTKIEFACVQYQFLFHSLSIPVLSHTGLLAVHPVASCQSLSLHKVPLCISSLLTLLHAPACAILP